MGLDYSKGCVNFRDVGEFINLIAARYLLPEGRLFRGGKLEFVSCAAEIQNPQTIINLRKGADTKLFDACGLHFPISNDHEKYETANKTVRLWLNKVMKTFENESLNFPVLFHCMSGKDRTGIAVASLLKILEIPEDMIIEEYMLSDGEVKKERIKQSLEGIGNAKSYFDRVDLEVVKKNIFKPQ